MTPKEYMEQVRALDRKIKAKEQMKSVIMSDVMRCTANISEMPRGGGSSVEDKLIRAIDLSREMDAEWDRLIDLKAEIKSTVNKLDDMDHQTVLDKRYFVGMEWEDIAKEMYVSRPTIFRLHGLALQALERHIPKHNETP